SKLKGSGKVNHKKSSYKTRTVSKPSKKVVSGTSSSKTASRSKSAVKTNKKTAMFAGSKRLSWRWPVKGKIIQRYSPGSGKKGIDISAAKGSLIKAAEAGKVVYSGQGLVGYGRLIIIKHNDAFLSAYAHNQSLLVNEGQVVKKGQSIARLGRSGTDGYKLHFEIRKNGKPVNPISYLPH
ncbi:MAG: peptidoglycan DD-metalloendopeptidase family protein, partial [Gammaproteobacteria bacterium]|nr:peptidoglycan DD-metalloendopeptidase family protein [Gammaproteobacteria bacterium]